MLDLAFQLHPVVVHFPIALLIVAAGVDIASVFWRDRLTFLALLLYVLGAIGAVAGYLSGQAAADAVVVSGSANVVLTTHADWATVTMWFFVVYALARVVIAWKTRWGARLAVHVPLVAVALGGLFLLYNTANNGGRLVFEHGVGVQAVDELSSALESRQRELARLQGQSELPVVTDDGSWQWLPGSHAAEAFAQAFVQPVGALSVTAHQDTAVALTVERSPALFVLEQGIQSVQVDLDLGLEDFAGTIQIIHNAQDSLNYHFTEIGGGRVKQGRVEDGTTHLMADEEFVPNSWMHYRVVSDRTHFRAYANGTMIAHGHGSAPGIGPVGLRISGEGTVLLGSFSATNLR